MVGYMRWGTGAAPLIDYETCLLMSDGSRMEGAFVPVRGMSDLR